MPKMDNINPFPLQLLIGLPCGVVEIIIFTGEMDNPSFICREKILIVGGLLNMGLNKANVSSCQKLQNDCWSTWLAYYDIEVFDLVLLSFKMPLAIDCISSLPAEPVHEYSHELGIVNTLLGDMCRTKATYIYF